MFFFFQVYFDDSSCYDTRLLQLYSNHHKYSLPLYISSFLHFCSFNKISDFMKYFSGYMGYVLLSFIRYLLYVSCVCISVSDWSTPHFLISLYPTMVCICSLHNEHDILVHLAIFAFYQGQIIQLIIEFFSLNIHSRTSKN